MRGSACAGRRIRKSINVFRVGGDREPLLELGEVSAFRLFYAKWRTSSANYRLSLIACAYTERACASTCAGQLGTLSADFGFRHGFAKTIQKKHERSDLPDHMRSPAQSRSGHRHRLTRHRTAPARGPILPSRVSAPPCAPLVMGATRTSNNPACYSRCVSSS